MPSFMSQPPRDKSGIFSGMGGLFSWVAELITKQAKNSSAQESASLALKRASHLSSKGRTKELLTRAEEIVKKLEFFKEELQQDFGQAAQAFINKSIDPILENAEHLIAEFSTKTGDAEPFSDILERAVQSVELYSQFKDETKLKRKIISEAISTTKLAIEKDFQILRRYQHHALQEFEGDAEGFKTVLDAKLEPIFKELRAIQHADTKTDDLREFFIWKSQVDEKRNALNELGFLTIDSTLQRKPESLLAIIVDDPKDLEELSHIETSLIAKSKELASLAVLEERALKLFELLEDTTSFHKEIFVEIERLLFDLKAEAESWQEARTTESEDDDAILQDTFQGLYESILRAEVLLEERKGESKKTGTDSA